MMMMYEDKQTFSSPFIGFGGLCFRQASRLSWQRANVLFLESILLSKIFFYYNFVKFLKYFPYKLTTLLHLFIHVLNII